MNTNAYSYLTVNRDGTDSLFQVGEELTYNVSYAFLDIGQVRIKVLEKVQDGDAVSYRALARMDSYKGIPLVNLHTTYESTISESLFTRWFRGRTKVDSAWRSVEYKFDYSRHRVYIEHGAEGNENITKRDSLEIRSFFQDGLSMFYHARSNVRTSQTMTVSAVVGEKKGNTTLHFKNERTQEKIDAVNYPIDVVHFDGKADFVGVFGLTGEFEGWFSNDIARVPILAKMKVIIGNIRIELMKWKRDGWVPPKYVESK